MAENDLEAVSSFEDALPYNDFDPLEELSFDDESTLEDGPFSMPNPDAASKIEGKLRSFSDKETANERIDALFEQMPTLHKILYKILEACAAPKAAEALSELIEELKANHHCVYTPSTFCKLLERAGAIEKTDEEGMPFGDIVQEPLKVEIDGVLYWKVAPAPPVFWNATEPGRARLESYQPLNMIQSCYDAEPHYADIFTTVLEVCARTGGAPVKTIDDAVNDEPVLQSPRRYAMYFIDKLEQAGALDWTGSWTITEQGQSYLDTLGGQSS